MLLLAAWVALQADPQDKRPPSEFSPLLRVEGKIDWFGGSTQDALEMARKTERLVLVHLWAHW
jgi:hypothetical protein